MRLFVLVLIASFGLAAPAAWAQEPARPDAEPKRTRRPAEPQRAVPRGHARQPVRAPGQGRERAGGRGHFQPDRAPLVALRVRYRRSPPEPGLRGRRERRTWISPSSFSTGSSASSRAGLRPGTRARRCSTSSTIPSRPSPTSTAPSSWSRAIMRPGPASARSSWRPTTRRARSQAFRRALKINPQIASLQAHRRRNSRSKSTARISRSSFGDAPAASHSRSRPLCVLALGAARLQLRLLARMIEARYPADRPVPRGRRAAGSTTVDRSPRSADAARGTVVLLHGASSNLVEFMLGLGDAPLAAPPGHRLRPAGPWLERAQAGLRSRPQPVRPGAR